MVGYGVLFDGLSGVDASCVERSVLPPRGALTSRSTVCQVCCMHAWQLREKGAGDVGGADVYESLVGVLEEQCPLVLFNMLLSKVLFNMLLSKSALLSRSNCP